MLLCEGSIMRFRLLATCLALVALAGACSDGGDAQSRPDQRATVAAPATTPAGGVAERGPLTKPDRALVENLAEGPYRARIRTAIGDLKAVGMWKKLTEELFVVEISARPGRSFVPEDAHLADAYRTLDIREHHAGVLCDITFYPTAMQDDLERWQGYFDDDLTTDSPPTVRQLWGSVLAHELSHCLKRSNDEASAQAWERRALNALREAGLR